MDTLRITVLPDGTIKTDTDKVSMPNHANAEAFLREMARLAGGRSTLTLKHGHGHLHDHEHEHQHEGHGH
jgi:hypothetical protein